MKRKLLVLVTGSEGFIGRSLTKKLTASNYKVIRFSKSLGDDITKKDSFKKLPHVDIIIHLAAKTYVPDSWNDPGGFTKVNFLGTLNALEYARSLQKKPKFILASAFIYGNTKNVPIKEDDTCQPNNPYAQSKYLAESLAEFYSKYYGIPSVVLRPFNIYGPKQGKHFLIPKIIEGIKSSQITIDDPRPKRDFIFIEDVVDAYLCAIKYRGPFKIFNIASGKSYSVDETVRLMVKISGKKVKIVFTNKKRKNEILDSKGSISQARKYLKWSPKTSLEAGLKKTLSSSL